MPEVTPELRAMLASMGMRHPSDGTPEERGEALAQAHERVASVFARIGNERDEKSARRAASIARKNAR